MNIYALEGHKIKAKNLEIGYNYEIENAKEHLEIGKIYTVAYTDIYKSYTKVYLKEIPDISFNSAVFKDVTPQSRENDQKHPQWSRYNYEITDNIEPGHSS